jgi:hypothetical protein
VATELPGGINEVPSSIRCGIADSFPTGRFQMLKVTRVILDKIPLKTIGFFFWGKIS